MRGNIPKGLELAIATARGGVRFFTGAAAPGALSMLTQDLYRMTTHHGKVTPGNAARLEGLFGKRLILEDGQNVLGDNSVALAADLKLPLSMSVFTNGNVHGPGISIFLQYKDIFMPSNRSVLTNQTLELSPYELYLAANLEKTMPGIGRLYAMGALNVSADILATLFDTTHIIDGHPADIMQALKDDDLKDLTIKPMPDEALLERTKASSPIDDLVALARSFQADSSLQLQSAGYQLASLIKNFGVEKLVDISHLVMDTMGGSLPEAEAALVEFRSASDTESLFPEHPHHRDNGSGPSIRR